jgi:hypothetical protein
VSSTKGLKSPCLKLDAGSLSSSRGMLTRTAYSQEFGVDWSRHSTEVGKPGVIDRRRLNLE